MVIYALLLVLNVLLIIDWAKNRRPSFWLFGLILLGPLGALAYLVYYYEEINFPIELAKTVRKLTGKKTLRNCPRCGRLAELKQHQDGRQFHFMCEACIDLTFAEPVDVDDILQAAADIIHKRDSE